MADLVVSQRGTGSYFTGYILKRIEENKNFISAITGQTGSGKSYASLKLGEMLDPDFSELNVCFSPREFMNLVNGKTKQLKKGSVIVFDEIQVSMGHLDYQSIQAKVLNYVFQTFRHRNFILFMTSPHFSFINASLRKLFHSRMETLSIDHKSKIATLKPMLIQVNQKTGDIYEKYLRVYHKDMGLVPLKSLRVSMASPELIAKYEEKKTSFTKELNESIMRDLDKLDAKENGTERKPLTAIQTRIVELLLQNKTLEEVAEGMGCGKSNISEQMRLIKKKGLDFKPIKEKGSAKVLYYEVSGDLEGLT